MGQPKVVSIASARRKPQQRLPVPASIFEGRPEPPFVLFDQRGRVISQAEARTVYVSPGDLAELDAYVYTHLQAIGADQYIAPTDRAWILQRVVLHEARDALQLRRGYQVRGLLSVAKQVATFALASDGRFSYLPPGLTDGPVELAANRALYAVALGTNGGMQDPAKLSGLLLAAIFADAGNTTVEPVQLVAGEGLSDEQWRIARGHPVRSAEIAQRVGLRSQLIRNAILGHHERWDGSGNPSGLSGARIPVEGRIMAIADRFALLSANGSAEAPRDAYAALREMSASSGEHDPDLLRRFVPLVGRAFGRQRSVGTAS